MLTHPQKMIDTEYVHDIYKSYSSSAPPATSNSLSYITSTVQRVLSFLRTQDLEKNVSRANKSRLVYMTGDKQGTKCHFWHTQDICTIHSLHFFPSFGYKVPKNMH
jgi:hypothetical protein